jgi:hypothetical protein
VREWSRISFNTDTDKKNRGEEAKGKKEEEATNFVGYLFRFFSYHYQPQKAWAGLFLVHRIEYKEKKWERWRERKITIYKKNEWCR